MSRFHQSLFKDFVCEAPPKLQNLQWIIEEQYKRILVYRGRSDSNRLFSSQSDFNLPTQTSHTFDVHMQAAIQAAPLLLVPLSLYLVQAHIRNNTDLSLENIENPDNPPPHLTSQPSNALRMPGDKQDTPMSMEEICQRCFLRLAQSPDHICVRQKGARKCQHCRAVRHACIPVSCLREPTMKQILTFAKLPEELMQEAEEAIKGPVTRLSARVRAVKYKIMKRTRNIRKDKKNQQYLDLLLTEALTPPESPHKSECEVCDDAYFNTAAEQQLLTSLADAANHSESEDINGETKVQADVEWEAPTSCDCQLGEDDDLKVERV